MPLEPRLVAVIGPGAIGTTVAGLLTRAGAHPFLAGRTPRPSLHLHTADGTVTDLGPVHVDPGAVRGPADVVFLAVKTTQTAGAAPWLSALCGPETVVCVLQNGIEQVATVGPLVPDSAVLPAVVWFPAERGANGDVRLLGAPHLTVPDGAGGATVRDVLAPACPVALSSDFVTEAWRKLLQNAVAGLMVLTGRRSGMFTRDDVGGLATAWLDECVAVARADGARLGADDAHRVLAAFRAFPADRGTSILADRQGGHPLEWRVRNGVVQRKGREHRVPTPISDVLVPLLAAASDGPG